MLIIFELTYVFNTILITPPSFSWKLMTNMESNWMNKGPQLAKLLGRGKGGLFWPDIKTCELIGLTAVWYWHMGR